MLLHHVFFCIVSKAVRKMLQTISSPSVSGCPVFSLWNSTSEFEVVLGGRIKGIHKGLEVIHFRKIMK